MLFAMRWKSNAEPDIVFKNGVDIAIVEFFYRVAGRCSVGANQETAGQPVALPTPAALYGLHTRVGGICLGVPARVLVPVQRLPEGAVAFGDQRD